MVRTASLLSQRETFFYKKYHFYSLKSLNVAQECLRNAPVIIPSGQGISGAFNFSIFKAPLKALLSGAKNEVKSLLKAPALPGADNYEEQQMT